MWEREDMGFERWPGVSAARLVASSDGRICRRGRSARGRTLSARGAARATRSTEKRPKSNQKQADAIRATHRVLEQQLHEREALVLLVERRSLTKRERSAAA